MSDLGGQSPEDTHYWKNKGTISHRPGIGNIFTEWECENCNAYFRHFYKREPNIFVAMIDWQLPVKCEGATEK